MKRAPPYIAYPSFFKFCPTPLPSPSLSLSLSVCLSICLSVCLSVSLSVCLSACLPVCLSVSLSLSLLTCFFGWMCHHVTANVLFCLIIWTTKVFEPSYLSTSSTLCVFCKSKFICEGWLNPCWGPTMLL